MFLNFTYWYSLEIHAEIVTPKAADWRPKNFTPLCDKGIKIDTGDLFGFTIKKRRYFP
jgi:hypothetical protein